MYGLINIAVEKWVAEQGPGLWPEVLETAGLSRDMVFTSTKHYDDADTYQICEAAAKVLGTSMHTVLYGSGELFCTWISKQGYGKLLQALGHNIVEFLFNLNDLHLHLNMSMPAMQAPTFAVEQITSTSLILHYRSRREGLTPLLLGLMNGAARECFNHDVKWEILRSREQGTSDHDVIRVTFPPQPAIARLVALARGEKGRGALHPLAPAFPSTVHATVPTPPATATNFPGSQKAAAGGILPLCDPLVSDSPPSLSHSLSLSLHDNIENLEGMEMPRYSMDASTFMMLHPFHIVFDAQLHVVQCGDAVRRVVDGLHGRDPHLPTTPHLNDLFRLQHPMVSPFTFEAMKGSLQNSFLLQVRATGMELKGQMVVVRMPAIAGCRVGEEVLLYLASPRVRNLDDLQAFEIFLSDLPLWDMSRDFVLLAEQRSAEASEKEQLEELAQRLQMTSGVLRAEQARANHLLQQQATLLHQILPRQVIDVLLDRIAAQAEEVARAVAEAEEVARAVAEAEAETHALAPLPSALVVARGSGRSVRSSVSWVPHGRTQSSSQVKRWGGGASPLPPASPTPRPPQSGTPPPPPAAHAAPQVWAHTPKVPPPAAAAEASNTAPLHAVRAEQPSQHSFSDWQLEWDADTERNILVGNGGGKRVGGLDLTETVRDDIQRPPQPVCPFAAALAEMEAMDFEDSAAVLRGFEGRQSEGLPARPQGGVIAAAVQGDGGGSGLMLPDLPAGESWAVQGVGGAAPSLNQAWAEAVGAGSQGSGGAAQPLQRGAVVANVTAALRQRDRSSASVDVDTWLATQEQLLASASTADTPSDACNTGGLEDVGDLDNLHSVSVGGDLAASPLPDPQPVQNQNLPGRFVSLLTRIRNSSSNALQEYGHPSSAHHPLQGAEALAPGTSLPKSLSMTRSAHKSISNGNVAGLAVQSSSCILDSYLGDRLPAPSTATMRSALALAVGFQERALEGGSGHMRLDASLYDTGSDPPHSAGISSQLVKLRLLEQSRFSNALTSLSRATSIVCEGCCDSTHDSPDHGSAYLLAGSHSQQLPGLRFSPVLPDALAPQLSRQDVMDLATMHDEVTILFADIKGFTSMSQQLHPSEVMLFLNHLYSLFDMLLEEHDVYKVETIGDCYMVATGLFGPTPVMTGAAQGGGGGDSAAAPLAGTAAPLCSGVRPAVRELGGLDPQHAQKALQFARAMVLAAGSVMTPLGEPVQLRVGMHSGPCMSGVVGRRMPRFCLYGDTVNTASRMESTGEPGRIHASKALRDKLPHEPWEATGGVEVKGKGMMQTYLLAETHGA